MGGVVFMRVAVASVLEKCARAAVRIFWVVLPKPNLSPFLSCLLWSEKDVATLINDQLSMQLVLAGTTSWCCVAGATLKERFNKADKRENVFWCLFEELPGSKHYTCSFASEETALAKDIKSVLWWLHLIDTCGKYWYYLYPCWSSVYYIHVLAESTRRCPEKLRKMRSKTLLMFLKEIYQAATSGAANLVLR